MEKRKKAIICSSILLLIGLFLIALALPAMKQTTMHENNQTGLSSLNDQTSKASFENSQDERQSSCDLPLDKSIDESQAGIDYDAGQVIVTFSDAAFDCEDVLTTSTELKSGARSILSEAKSVNADSVSRLDNKTAIVKLNDGVSVAQAVRELSDMRGVSSVQPDYIYTLADSSDTNYEDITAALSSYSATNDPLTESNQWSISGTGERVIDAWGEQKSDEKVTIAILDTGIDSDHEDLKDNIVEAANCVTGESGSSAKDTTTGDNDSHGTHCAGIAAARTNNNIGISGVSYNAKILSIKVCDGEYFKWGSGEDQKTWITTGANASSIAKGIKYAVSKKDESNVKVISMSLTRSTSDDLIKSAIDEAYEAGITVVAASGNDSKSGLQPVTFPASYEKCIAVGGTAEDGSRMAESNGSAELDVVAPGSEIFSTIPYDATNASGDVSDYSTKYAKKSGTSMAAPYAAGVVALMYAANPNLTPENVLNILTTTTDSSTAKFSSELGYGKVNAYQAVREAKRIAGNTKTYRVFFDVNGGSFTSNVDLAQVVQSGVCATEPSNITKVDGSALVLEGWYKDSALQTKWNFSDPVTSEMTLYAKWTSVACQHTNKTKKADTPATCIVAGKSGDTVCEDCGEVLEEGNTLEVDPNNHTSLVDVTSKQPTCTDDGYNTHQHCNGCGLDVGKLIDKATGHTSVVQETIASTCKTHGTSGIEVCSTCGAVTNKGTTLDLDPENHVNKSNVAGKAATCLEAGYSEYEHCQDCGADIGKTELPAKGHEIETVVVEATCTHGGSKTTTCKNCNYRNVETISQLEHVYESGYCKACGAKDPDFIEPEPVPDTFTLDVTAASGITVKLDKAEYVSGESAKITISGSASGNNLIVPNSLRVDGAVVKTRDQLLNKSTWLTANDIYKKVMNEDATIVKYDTVAESLQQGTTVEISNLSSSTKIEVTAEELVPVYRLYNSITSEHLFTTNKTEYDDFVKKSESGEDYWIGEGINWFAASTSTQVVRRLYNPALGAIGSSSHYYSSSESEINNLINNFGWQDDGAANQFNSYGDVAIWTCYNEGLGSAHHYTSSKSEWLGLKNHGWDIEEAKNGTLGVFQGVMSALS